MIKYGFMMNGLIVSLIRKQASLCNFVLVTINCMYTNMFELFP